MTDKKASTTNEQSGSTEQGSDNALEEKLSDQDKTTDATKITNETVIEKTSEKSHDNSGEKPLLSSRKKTVKSTKAMTDTMTENTPQKMSKLALFSLIIALAAAAGIGGLHFWQTQQQQLLEERLLKQNASNAANTEQQITQQLKQQQTNLVQQLQSTIQQFEQHNQTKINQLESTIARLSQNQPSDWLIHEAEYLIRIASRTIWLEQDTKAAINLLSDADNRLQELNDPEFLAIRQYIHDDIESLKLMPTLRTEEVVLTLMSLSKQINTLPLAMVYIPDSTSATENFELSDDANDWRTNLEKTWQKFLKDFITVSRRTANVEPLMSPQHQQNLRQNLALKLQLAQWAASEGKAELYLNTLDDISAWLLAYFDMELLSNQQFSQSIQSLKNELITFDYPNSLNSLKAIRKELSNKKITLEVPAESAVEKQEIDTVTPIAPAIEPIATDTKESEGA